MIVDRLPTQHHGSSDLVRSGRSWWLLAIPVVLALVVVVSLRSPAVVDEAFEASPDEVDPTETVPPSTILPTPNRARVPGPISLGEEVRAVVSSPIGLSPRLVTWEPGGAVTSAELPEFFDFDFDSSGRWLAAIERSLGTRDPTQPVPGRLWIGRVGEELAPVAERVMAFAWHDSSPASIAWQVEDPASGLESDDGAGASLRESVVVTAEVGQRADGQAVVRAETRIDPDLVLDVWGSMGFSFSAFLTLGRTTTIDSDRSSSLVIDGQGIGWLADKLLVTGRGVQPELVDPLSGLREPVRWLTSDMRVWAVHVSPTTPDLVAVQITENNFNGLGAGHVLLVDVAAFERGDPDAVRRIAAPGPTDLAWSANGEFLAFATQGALEVDPELSIVVVKTLGERGETFIAKLAPGEWLQAIAVG